MWALSKDSIPLYSKPVIHTQVLLSFSIHKFFLIWERRVLGLTFIRDILFLCQAGWLPLSDPSSLPLLSRPDSEVMRTGGMRQQSWWLRSQTGELVLRTDQSQCPCVPATLLATTSSLPSQHQDEGLLCALLLVVCAPQQSGPRHLLDCWHDKDTQTHRRISLIRVAFMQRKNLSL